MSKSNEDLLKDVAHELRQPLSTIESIAYYLELALPQADPRVRDQVSRLRHLVAQSGWILSDAIALARPQASHPERVDLNELISEFLLDHAYLDSSRVEFATDLEAGLAWLDVQQARELITATGRLLETLAAGGSIVKLHTRNLSSGAVLLRASAQRNPQDHSLPSGTCLVLQRLERLVEDNSGSLSLNLSDPEHLEVLLEFPAAPQSPALSSALPGILPATEAVAPPEPVAPGIA